MEAITETIAAKVIERLTSLALEEFDLFRNLNYDLQRMKEKVSAIKAVLLDAKGKAADHQVSVWLEKLKDTLCDADDLLDDFSTEALKRDVMTRNKMAKKVRIFFSKSNQILYSLRMGHRVREIRQRLDDIGLPESPVEYNKIKEWSETYSLVHEDDIIGREQEKKDIISLVLGPNVKDVVPVIAIVGIGGLGKTTLAQLVYNDEGIKNHFQEKMWVCVSDELVVNQIAQKMLGNINWSDPIEQVQQKLIDKIKAKKFLLVLDNVWNEDHELWHDLQKLLMKGAKGSMVIVTTRSERVAKAMGARTTYVLKGLDDEKSWKLFSKKAFENGQEPNNPELVAIGKDIVKKCDGVPLAIRSIGSLLYTQRLERSVWSYFRDVEFAKMDKAESKFRDVEFAKMDKAEFAKMDKAESKIRDVEFAKMDKAESKILAVLKLSYDHLSSPLKNCFAYRSLFPKDIALPRQKLIQLWIAEGFIYPTDQTRSLEEVGHDYYMDLISKSFFQEFHEGWCKMHDLMHDLALSVAGNEYVNTKDGKIDNITEKTHHLSLVCEIGPIPSQFPTWLTKARKLRTCQIITQQELRESDLNSIFSSLKRLRVLALEVKNLGPIPGSIEKLKHLRYLSLSYNLWIKKLPRGIVSLHNLQTLELNHCYRLEELPRDINKLVSLRNLELEGCSNLLWMPRGLVQLACLQTLTKFAMDYKRSDSARISELGGLNNLRGSLEIDGLEELRGSINVDKADKVESEFAKLIEKPYLQQLTLTWRKFYVWSEEDRRKDEMILQGLRPHQSLRVLSIVGFCGKRLPEWILNLSSLSRLGLWDCTALASLPEGIHNLTSLENLKIHRCPQLKRRYEKEVGDDWPKIARIPNVSME